ncbi:MAG TPA: endo alpha-1,4 polygalactosaminidase [Myxococcales bacterium]|nr:endo alpha-1,4 polygalactosaminidase [Myxococcales bacterium]
MASSTRKIRFLSIATGLALAACGGAAQTPYSGSNPDGGVVDGGQPDGGAPDGGAADGGTRGAGIWHPASGTTWQWQLQGTIDTTVAAAMYDIDLFDAPQATIDDLHAKGRIVVCYFSAGTYENWRPDATSFPNAALGNPVAGWSGEWWVDTRSSAIRSIMQARLDLAVQKKCDGVEPDNVDGYTNNPGFPLTATTQLDYNGFLATEAHARNLSIGLKNDVDQVAALEPSFDWALNEECSKYSECATLKPFVDANKAVFHAEYTSACPAPVPGHSLILKHLSLDAWRVVCP